MSGDNNLDGDGKTDDEDDHDPVFIQIEQTFDLALSQQYASYIDNDGDAELLGRSGELADALEPRDLRVVGENHREVLWAGRGRPADQRAEQRERRK